MENKIARKLNEYPIILDFFSITLGCLLTVFSVSFILVPNNLSTSGLTGLSLVMEKFSGINYTHIYYVLAISILIASYIFMGKKYLLKIVFVSILYSSLLVLVQGIDYVFVRGDMFLVCIYFSLFYGVGGGLVLRRGYTFGGTDTVARILKKKVFRDVNISHIMLVIDAVIILILGLTFGKDIALYALVNHVMVIMIMDYMLFGFRTKLYKVSVICRDHHEITEFIFKELGRGVTVHEVLGGYTKEKKFMVTCICSPAQSAIIRRYLAENNPDLFMEVAPMVSVYAIGNRFTKMVDQD